MKHPLARKVSLTLGTTLLVLGLLGVFVYRSTTRLAENAGRTAHTHQVLGHMDEVVRGLNEAGARRCAYLLTTREEHAPDFHDERDLIDREFRGLQAAGADDPGQKRKLEEAERLSRDLLALWERSVRVRQGQRFNVKGQWRLTQEGEQKLASVRKLFTEVKEEENARLSRWEAQARDSARDTIVALDMGNFLVLAVAGLAVVGIRRDLRLRQVADEARERALQEQGDRCRRLEEQVRHCQKLSLMGRLVGGVVHDCNNLLSVVLNCCGVALHKLRRDDPVRELVGLILQAGERVAALTRQLLAFSRNQPAARRPLDLNRVVADMEPMARCLLGRDVEWAADLEPGLRPVRADRAQLEQVLLNLIVNARDAMPGGGRLVVRTRNVPEGGLVQLAVSDTGYGMGPEVLARLFEPFFTTKGEGKGTGLGMAILQEIVQEHGGQVRVESTPGQGTMVRVSLPAESPAGPPPESPATLLVVDPEGALDDGALRLLHQAGYTVLRAGREEEAVEISRGHQGPIHLLVADLSIPGTSGPDLAGRLTRLHPEMRVLYLAEGQAVHLRADPGSPEGAVLPRPFTLEALGEKLREVLGVPRPHDC